MSTPISIDRASQVRAFEPFFPYQGGFFPLLDINGTVPRELCHRLIMSAVIMKKGFMTDDTQGAKF